MNFRSSVWATLAVALSFLGSTIAAAEPPEGFRALFNSTDLTGWHGRPHFDPRDLAKMPDDVREKKIAEWTEDAKKHWTVENGELVNDGYGTYLTTNDDFTDYELLIEYRTVPKADSGIYLKANPQVQIWDIGNEEQFKNGCQKGSGGLWNNSPELQAKIPPKSLTNRLVNGTASGFARLVLGPACG